MSAMIHDIGVVGAGFSGLAFCTALLARAPALQVIQFGDAAQFGVGYAYGPAAGDFLLNSRADQMGVDAAADFADWLGLAGEARHGFQPRAVFGRYLRHRHEDLVQTQRQRLHCQPGLLVRAQRCPDGWQVFDQDGREQACRRLVLACGALPARPLPQLVAAGLHADPRCIAEPLRAGALADIAPDSRVLILGSGPTMIDTALALLDGGHRGDILALSRHGLIPRPHAPGTPVPAQPPPAFNGISAHAGLAALRQRIAESSDWRPHLDGLRAHLPDLWRRADASERRRFLRHVAPWWSVHRHRLPPAQWQRLAPAIERGQLRILAGRLLAVGDRSPDLRVILRTRGGRNEEIDIAALVQTIGFGQHLGDNPLLASLVDAGHLRADPFALGADSDADGHALDRDGRRVDDLFLLGALTRGEGWDITAVPELRQAAIRLAERLAGTA